MPVVVSITSKTTPWLHAVGGTNGQGKVLDSTNN